MANTRFKTYHGLNATANSIIDGKLEVTGDLVVDGNIAFSGTSNGDVKPDTDQRNLGNTTLRWNLFGFAANLASTLTANGATSLGNTLGVNGAVTFQNTLTVVGWVNTAANLVVGGSASISGQINVAGNSVVVGISTANGNTSFTNGLLTVNTNGGSSANILTVGAANVSVDSGVLFIDAVNNRVGINNTAPGVALRVTGAVDVSSTANVQGNANVGGSFGVAGVTTLTGNTTLSGTLQTVAGNVNFDSGVLFVDSVDNRIGINNTAPTVALEVSGAANVTTSVNSALLTVGTDFIANTTGAYHTGTVNAASFTTTNFRANTTGAYPASNSSGTALGNSTARWVLTANTGNFSGSIVTGNSTTNSTISSIDISSNTSTILTGTVSSNTTSPVVNGTSTLFSTELVAGDIIKFSGCTAYFTVSSITNSTSLTLTTNSVATTANTVEKKFIQVVNNSGLYLYGASQRILPFSNGAHSLGNTTARWSVVGNTADFSGLATLSSGLIVTGTANVSTLFYVGTATVINTTSANIATYYAGAINTLSTGLLANSSTLLLGNSSVNVQINTSSINVATHLSGAIGAASNGFLANSSLITVGNTSVNVQIDSSGIISAGSSGVNPFSNSIGTALGSTLRRWVVTANSITTSGAGIIGTTLAAGNTSITGFANASVSVNSALLTVGTSFIANTLGVYHTGTVNAASFTTTATTVTGILANTTALVPTGSSANTVLLGNSISRWVLNANTGNFSSGVTISGDLTLGSQVSANGTVGTAGQVLISGGAANAYWGAAGVTVTNDTSTDATRYILFEDNTSGSVTEVSVSSTKLTFNPSSGVLSAVEFSATSDERLKSEITSIDNAVDLVNAMRGVGFIYNHTGRKGIGVIAQEIESVLPEVVNQTDDGYKSVNYGNIVGVLIEAIKELKREIDELKNGDQG
jgi:hypothetical protein